MKKLNIKTLLFFALLAVAFSACEKDPKDPDDPQTPDNDGEVITTLKLVFTAIDANGSDFTATFRDSDGDGGNGPDIFDTIKLASNATYSVQIILLNETASPIDTISNEVAEENYDHLFCFTPAGANVTITRTDSDGKYEVGLESKWETGAASSGTVQVVLKHQPDIKTGSCDPGETDIDVLFPTVVN